MQADPRLDLMAEIAQPLDEWCEFCKTKLATMRTADGVGACAECGAAVIEALKKYAEDAAFLARKTVRAVSAGQAKARAKRRVKRKRTKR